MADAISAKTAWALANAIKSAVSPPSGKSTQTATFVRRDTDGTCWVRLAGNDFDTPVNGQALADAEPGQTVQCAIDGTSLTMVGNVSDPAVGVARMTRAVGSVSDALASAKASLAKASENAQKVADAAKSVADAVNQHFFADTHGIHVTEATQEDWEQSHTGPNVLINSVGQLFRDGLNNLLTLTTEGNARALTIWDGLGNAASNVRAVFGETITLGNASDGSMVTIDSDSMDMLHGQDEMLHFGYGLGAAASGTANAPYYTIGTRAANSTVGNYSVAEGYGTVASGYCSHAEGRGTTASGKYSHAEGHNTTASTYYSHAEGHNTTASGQYSHAEGYSTTITEGGLFSHAQNYGTIAASESQTAMGMFNVKDANNTYLLIIGNGTSNSARSNALTVDWDGNVTHGVDVPWTNLQLASSVEAYSDGQTPRYRKWGPVVQVLGAVKLKSNQSAGFNVNIGTLPSGCRPLTQVATVCQGSGNDTWLCNVSAGGVMNIERYRNGGTSAAATTSTWLPFSITFLTA